ncbi:MAG TPA: nucleotidyltransferase domain-containing protein [Candidatus Deferrimicrobium sp.]|nr:nucleotidyltransferase domain-containing protein [Candidatus Deferrimicrobium sp.]
MEEGKKVVGDIKLAKREIIDIIRKYGEKLKEQGINFQKIILFGSYAANTERRDSDIDIAVVSEDFGKDRFKERVVLTKIAYYIDARIEPHPVNLKEFINDSWKTIIHEIKSKGIEIAAWGKADLKKKAKTFIIIMLI